MMRKKSSSFGPVFCQAVFALLLARVAPANADILIRFPSDVAGDRVTALASEISQITGIKTWGITGAADSHDDLGDPPTKASNRLDKAIKAYKQLDLEKAETLLEKVEADCLAESSLARCRPVLYEANMLRGVIASALGNDERAGQYFRSAHLINPSSVVDPRMYPPRTIRTYNSACAAAQNISPAQVALKSVPPGATFKINGDKVDEGSTAVSLSPGRHVIEAEMTGYAAAREVVEIDSRGNGPKEITLTLAELPDLSAWEQLRQQISSPPYDMTGPGLVRLFERFDVDHIIILEPAGKGGSGFDAFVAKPGELELRPLPRIGLLGGSLPREFAYALEDALGLERKETSPGPLKADQTAKPLDSNAVEEDDEVEEANVRFDANRAAASDEGDLKKIVASPWFWVSVGIVTAMVAGVVIGSQVD